MMARKFLQRQSRSGSKVFDKEDGKDIVGTLNVCVLDGVNLEAKDATGTSDPFCSLFLASNKNTKQKTKFINGTLNPNWGEEFKFVIHDISDTLVVECFDKDFMSKDFIGSFEVPVIDYYLQPICEKYFKLLPKPPATGDVGEIRLQIFLDIPDVSQDLVTVGESEFCSQLPKPTTREEQVIQEWLRTEESYVADLRILRDKFLADLERKQLLRKHQIYEIFANLKDILAIHEKMMDDFFANNSLQLDSLLTVFEYYLNQFSLYVEYCSNQSNASIKIAEYAKVLPDFGNFLSMKRMDYRGLNTEAFIVKPLQRLVKYPLLLREIKATKPSEEQSTRIDKITDKLNEFIKMANEETVKREQLHNIEETHKMVEKSGLYGKLIKKFDFYHSFVYGSKITCDDLKTDSSLTLMIFEDFLLILCSSKIHLHVPLLNIHCSDGSAGGHHLLKISTIGRKINVEFPSIQELSRMLLVLDSLRRRLMLQRLSPYVAQSGANTKAKIEKTNLCPEIQTKADAFTEFIDQQRQKRLVTESKVEKLSNSLQEIQKEIEILNRQVVTGDLH